MYGGPKVSRQFQPQFQFQDFTAVYRPGTTNTVDALSRLKTVEPCDSGQAICVWLHHYHRIETSVPIAVSPREIEEASYNDEGLCEVKKYVRPGKWEHYTLPSYVLIKDELCIYGESLLRGTRIVVPRIQRDKVVRLAHEVIRGWSRRKIDLEIKFGGRRT